MTSGHLIEDNEMHQQGKYFYPSSRAFNATGKAELNANADALADVRKAYPYPPANCEEAIIAIKNIEAAMLQLNENISGGVTKNVGQRYLQAYSQVLNEFNTYVNAKQCIETALMQDDEAVKQELKAALDAENTATEEKDKKNNIIIFGALGILFVTATVIILFKKK